jgi:hypothetical protein
MREWRFPEPEGKGHVVQRSQTFQTWKHLLVIRGRDDDIIHRNAHIQKPFGFSERLPYFLNMIGIRDDAAELTGGRRKCLDGRIVQQG